VVASTEPTMDLERSLLSSHPSGVVVAIDEVGRGALAGPVTIGAVAVGLDCVDPPSGIRDSKALSERRRRDLCEPIRSWAVEVVVVHVPATRIDEVGITRALGEGAVEATAEIAKQFFAGSILLDGRHDFVTPIDGRWPVHTVIKGDATCVSIAAASIVAKQERDALMRDLHRSFPSYAWDRNVGYGTAAHRAAITQYGLTAQHRASWNLG
jgi:ribonuclease HII